MTTDIMVKRIRETLDAVGDKSRQEKEKQETNNLGNGWWTEKIKSDLAELAKEFNCKAYASSCENVYGGEWLYDMTWLEMEGKEVCGVKLIMESEWARRNIKDDFPKLVIGRADLRLMIFEAPDEKEYNVWMKYFKNEINGNRMSVNGDRYLFACWMKGEGFRFAEQVFLKN